MTKEDNTLFIMRPTEGAKKALGHWLADKTFNTFTEGWKDKKGNLGIGLQNDTGRGKPDKVAVIICLDDSFDTAITIVEQHLGYGDEQ